MVPLTVAQKNGNDFQIIFARFVFLSSDTGLWPKAPQISSPVVSVTDYFNVSLKCLVSVRPSDCWDNSLQWYFNNSSVKLKSGEKYEEGQPTPNAKKISFSPLLMLLMQTKESINVSGSPRMTTPAFPGLQLSS